MSAPRANSSSMTSICRVITAQWMGWLDRSSPACSSSGEASSRFRTPAGHARIAAATARLAVSTLHPAELGSKQLLQLPVAAVAADIQQRVVHGQAEGIGAVLKQKIGDVDVVFPHREVERRAIGVAGADQRGIVVDQPLDRRQVARDARAEHAPHVGASAGGPLERLVFFEFVGLDHAAANSRNRVASLGPVPVSSCRKKM